MKIRIQRLIEVWVEDVYEVDDLSPKTLEKAVMYEFDPECSETLWETQIDRGPYEIYDEKGHLIEKHE